MYTCTMTAEDWQAYSDMPGAEEAARELSALLTTEVRRAKAQLAEIPELSERKLAARVHGVLYDAMCRYSSLGFADSEPLGLLVDEVEDALGLSRYSLSR